MTVSDGKGPASPCAGRCPSQDGDSARVVPWLKLGQRVCFGARCFARVRVGFGSSPAVFALRNLTAAAISPALESHLGRRLFRSCHACILNPLAIFESFDHRRLVDV